MSGNLERTAHFRGTPREVGVAAGRLLGQRLEENISHYIQRRPRASEVLDKVRLQTESMRLFRSLPARFQEELEGLAEGAGIPVQRVAEWVAVEQCVEARCSGLISVIDGHAWVGRNNDFLVPEAFGFVAIKEINGRIPTVTFGMEGDVFTVSGINQEQLWIHSQYLPAPDRPRPDVAHFPGYIILPEALETCSSIRDVERLLGAVDRDTGEIWFVADGKTDEFVLFECNCQDYVRRDPVEGRLYATNHTGSTGPAEISESSARRFRRLIDLVGNNVWEELPDDLIAILADDAVEQRADEYITVESMVACPAEKKLWYTLGGCPAASLGKWTRISWPW